jgi:transcriptional regulator with XRE-family HTH domain
MPFAWASFATGVEMQRKRREDPQPATRPRWNASQLVAFNLARARRKAELTQQEAAEAISRYTETEWTQATVATAESSVTGARIRQFSPSELLAFCFAFDVPIGWFFMPPSGDEAESLEMPKHAGIDWDWVFRRTTPTEANIDAYLGHQGDWARQSEQTSQRRPFHDRVGDVLRGGSVLRDEELQTYFLLGLLRRGLGGSSDLKRGTVWGEGLWFSEASGVLQRVADVFAAIGGQGPSPRQVMRQKDAEDSNRIWDEIYRKRDEAKGPICGECLLPIVNTDPEGDGSWVHADETVESARHTIVAVV